MKKLNGPEKETFVLFISSPSVLSGWQVAGWSFLCNSPPSTQRKRTEGQRQGPDLRLCSSAVEMDRYTKQEKAGQGTYGVVYKSLDKTDNQFVALKVSLGLAVEWNKMLFLGGRKGNTLELNMLLP